VKISAILETAYFFATSFLAQVLAQLYMKFFEKSSAQKIEKFTLENCMRKILKIQ
jgi:hypothetical protein